MHTEKFGLPTPAFVNAGDGQYTHPLGELLDIFSLLEQKRWDRSTLHIALVGDLAHGRTAHSKVDGLKVFNQVRVDLVAPSVFQYPVEYRNAMWSNGFQVREFDSVEAYLDGAADSVATIWYFCQPQFKRVGEVAQATVLDMRSKITFRAEWQRRLPAGVCFLQTLPRDKENPVIPLAFDPLPLNCWDKVANNAFFLYTVLLGMLYGKFGRGLPQQPPRALSEAESELRQSSLCPFAAAARGSPLPTFMEPVPLMKDHSRRPERADSGGAVPLMDGLVIDHIGVSSDSASVWQKMYRVRTILGWAKKVGYEGVYSTSKGPDLMKGIMSLPNFDFESITVPQMKVLASIAPDCTMNAVANSAVIGKYRLHVPERIYNLPIISCKNKLCISNPLNKQRDVVTSFERVPFYQTSVLPNCKKAQYLFVCKYCQWPHEYEAIWN